MRGADVLGSQSERFHHSGAQVLHDDVGRRDQIPGDLLSAIVFQVECDAAFVAVVVPQDRFAVGADQSRRFAVHRFDFDHVGAEVHQNLGGGRGGDELSEIDDANSGQRSGHAAFSFVRALSFAASCSGRTRKVAAAPPSVMRIPVSAKPWP